MGEVVRRCKELGLQTPDPTLLVRALDTLGKVIGNKSPTAGWRLYNFRHQYQIDVVPTEATVLHFCQLSTTELETLSLTQQEVGKQQRLAALQTPSPKDPKETPSSKPAAKPAGGRQPPPPPPKVGNPKTAQGSPLDDRGICKFFGSVGGCRYGRTCMHPHEQLSPSDSRCFNCGATGHSMQECERPSKAVPKMPSGGKASPEAFVPQHQAAPKQVAAPKRGPRVRKMEAASEAAATGESATQATATFQNASEENIERMLKSVACPVDGPRMVATLKGIEVGKSRGLLDGGATHSLRYATPAEYRLARPVQVHLASGSTYDLRMNTVGTLLSQDPEVQPIVPTGLLAEELRCTITWKGKQCCVIHPDLGKLDVTVCRGCPDISHDLSLSLILELEEQRSDTMLGKVRKAGVRRERPETANAQKTFPEVPVPLREKLLPKHAYSQSLSGLNRHCRRRLERGSAFVHLFAGGQKNQHPQGVPAVDLDLKAGHDFRDDGLYAYLLQLAFQGNISFLLAGPPCRTVSALKQRGAADGGPGVVRQRSGTQRCGIQGSEPGLTQLVEGDSLLILRAIILAEASNTGLEAARDAKGSVNSEAGVPSGWLLFFGMEHPEDPLEYLSAQKVEDKEEVPSIWVWPELRQFVERNGLYEASFHQGS